MTNYKTLSSDEETYVKSRLTLLKHLGFTILTRRNIFLGDFLVGNMTGGLQIAPEREDERIDIRYEDKRRKLEYKDTFQITSFTSPYGGILPCRCIFTSLKLTTEQRWEDMQGKNQIFPKENSFHYYVYPTFGDFQDKLGSDRRAYLAPRELIESTGILEESQA